MNCLLHGLLLLQVALVVAVALVVELLLLAVLGVLLVAAVVLAVLREAAAAVRLVWLAGLEGLRRRGEGGGVAAQAGLRGVCLLLLGVLVILCALVSRWYCFFGRLCSANDAWRNF